MEGRRITSLGLILGILGLVLSAAGFLLFLSGMFDMWQAGTVFDPAQGPSLPVGQLLGGMALLGIGGLLFKGGLGTSFIGLLAEYIRGRN